ncbi:hypothetical protein [Rhizobium sp. 21-4511-3d]
MTKHIPTGGPAFPVECNIVSGYRDDSGMTLRDWFAGKALMGLMASERATDDAQYQPDMAADRAYRMADAMLAEKFKAEEINAQAAREIEDDPF